MSEQKYSVSMQTPLGRKSGTLRVKTEGARLIGTLDILKHCEPFEGTIDENQNCRIAGVLVTLIRRISYTATGKITSTEVRLTLRSERNIFELYGDACPESEVQTQ